MCGSQSKINHIPKNLEEAKQRAAEMFEGVSAGTMELFARLISERIKNLQDRIDEDEVRNVELSANQELNEMLKMVDKLEYVQQFFAF